MSWDVMICKFAGTTPATAEEIDNENMIPLGAAAEVRNRISEILPMVDWSAPSWGILDGDGFSIEFNVGEDDPITDMMLHVRGGGDAVTAIMSFVGRLGWSALDTSTSEFLDPKKPSQEGWKGFQDFRDRAMGDS